MTNEFLGNNTLRRSSYFLDRWTSSPLQVQVGFSFLNCTVECRFNEVPRDWGNLFVISKVRYIHRAECLLFLGHLLPVQKSCRSVISRVIMHRRLERASIIGCHERTTTPINSMKATN